MYNLRYHLATICAIFLALALGLLLGAVIAGSDLVRDTSEDLVESLRQEFTAITEENRSLTEKYTVESAFSEQLLTTWQADRLQARDVAVLAGTTAADSEIATEVAAAITASGGTPVTISVSKASFGLDDATVDAALKKVLPAVDGEDYTVTLARALVNEWTRTQPEDASEGTDAEGTGTEGTDAEGADTEGTDAEDAEQRIETDYPVTTVLMDAGVLEIAGESSVPVTINGLVNTLVVTSDATTVTADPVGGEIASFFEQMGQKGALPYTPVEKADQESAQADTQGDLSSGGQDTTEEATDGVAAETEGSEIVADSDAVQDGTVVTADEATDDGTGNSTDAAAEVSDATADTSEDAETDQDVALSYYVVFVQDAERSTDLMNMAARLELSGVTSFDDAVGYYSMVALLSGGRVGVYGSDRGQEYWFPPLPTDTVGNAVFSASDD